MPPACHPAIINSMVNLSTHLTAALPMAYHGYLQAVRHAAAAQETAVYLVGGFVRDLILGRATHALDLDLVFEGPAIPIAQAVAAELGGRVQAHPAFGTATWTPPDTAETLDFITARREWYAHPGALPTIQPSHIHDDLARRDFSINAIALRLDGAYWGELLDEHHGGEDLQQGIIRALHPASFADDATRMWRAVRYEQRLGFAMDPTTAAWLQRDLPYLATITPARMAHEVWRTLAEPTRTAALARADALGLLADCHPDCHWPASAAAAFGRAPATAAPAHFLALWLAYLPAPVRHGVLARFACSQHDQLVAEGVAAVYETAATWTGGTPPSQVVHALQPWTAYEAIWLIAPALFGPGTIGRDYITRYVNEWRHVRLTINGHTLRQRGVPPGPRYRAILADLLAAKLDGDLPTAAAEQAWLDKLLSHE